MTGNERRKLPCAAEDEAEKKGISHDDWGFKMDSISERKGRLEQKACAPPSTCKLRLEHIQKNMSIYKIRCLCTGEKLRSWPIKILSYSKKYFLPGELFKKIFFAGGVIQKINVMCKRTAYTTSPTADMIGPCNWIIITCATGLPDQTVWCKNIIIYLHCRDWWISYFVSKFVQPLRL